MPLLLINPLLLLPLLVLLVLLLLPIWNYDESINLIIPLLILNYDESMIEGDHYRRLGSLLLIRIAGFADALSLMLLQSASVPPLLILMLLLLLLIDPLVLLLLLSIRNSEHENYDKSTIQSSMLLISSLLSVPALQNE